MAKARKWSLAAIGAVFVATLVAVAGASTKTSTTTVGTQKPGSASVKCPKGKTAVAANVVGEAASSGPFVEVNTLARTGERKVKTKAYNFGSPGHLTAIARCRTRPRSKLVSATAPVPASTINGSGEGTATAKCPRGKQIVFGGFRARRNAGAPDYVFLEVDSAKRVKGQRWRVHAFNVSSDGSGTVQALAYCGKVRKTQARTATTALGQFETGSAEAKCRRGATVRYWGFEWTPDTPGEIALNAIKRSAPRRLRVTATERFYLSPGTTTGLTAIAYCG